MSEPVGLCLSLGSGMDRVCVHVCGHLGSWIRSISSRELTERDCVWPALKGVEGCVCLWLCIRVRLVVYVCIPCVN